MNEERLIEITSTISMLDGPFVILGYLATLSSDDLNYITECIKDLGYASNNDFYHAVKLFATSYLNDKKKLDDTPFLKEFGYKNEIGEIASFGNGKNYLEEYALADDQVKISSSRR